MENNILELKPFIGMGAEKLREELYLLIGRADEEYLKAIHMLLVRRHKEEEQPLWHQLDKEQKTRLSKKLEQGEEDVAEGRVHTIKEVREMKKGW